MRNLWAVVPLALMSACLPKGVVDRAAPIIPSPAHYSSAKSAMPFAERRDPWWTALSDASVTALIDQALSSSLDLQVTMSRVRQADAMAAQARAARWPTVALTGSGGYNRSIQPGFGAIDSVSVRASLPVSYEVDLFARRAATADAAKIDAEAARLDMNAGRMTLAAQVADAWFDVVDARARERLLQEQFETNKTYFELVSLRFEQGLTAVLDVHQQRQQMLSVQSQLSLVEGEKEILLRRLALLVGVSPSELISMVSASANALPKLGPPPSTGVPADLIRYRPDVEAAQMRVSAADRRVGAAIAARLPSLTLSVTPGVSWLKVFRDEGDSVSSGLTISASAGLTVPLWDGGMGKAQVAMQRAIVQEQIARMSQVLLNALIEVETAIITEKQQRKNIEQLAEQVELSQATLDAARSRYGAGLSDFLPVLTALGGKQGAERALLSSRRRLISSRIQLHRALGGSWSPSIADPKDYPLVEEDEVSDSSRETRRDR